MRTVLLAIYLPGRHPLMEGKTVLQIVEDNVLKSRKASAERIRQLMMAWAENTLKVAAELAHTEITFPINPKRPHERPGFMKWAKETTGLSESQINNLRHIHKKFGHQPGGARLSGKVMLVLSGKDVPESARSEVIGRTERGEKLGAKEAKKIAEKHKLPGPKAANQQAKEEGRPVLASDGFIYFGTDPDKAKEGQDRRTMVYGVREALDHLGNIHLTGRQFLDYAFPHQLWTPDEAPIIKKALRWLTDLADAWESRK